MIMLAQALEPLLSRPGTYVPSFLLGLQHIKYHGVSGRGVWLIKLCLACCDVNVSWYLSTFMYDYFSNRVKPVCTVVFEDLA